MNPETDHEDAARDPRLGLKKSLRGSVPYSRSVKITPKAEAFLNARQEREREERGIASTKAVILNTLIHKGIEALELEERRAALLASATVELDEWGLPKPKKRHR